MKRLTLATGLVFLAACADSSTAPTSSANISKPSFTLSAGDNTVAVREADIARQAENTFPTNTWVFYTRNAATGTFVAGPGTPPIGNGSFQISTPGSNDKGVLFNYDHIGTPLSSITAIAYNTYQVTPNPAEANQLPAINIEVDVNGAAEGGFTTLVYEPVYNNASQPIVGSAWQSWDAYNGVWWSSNTVPGLPNRDTFVSWATVLSNNPDAVIVGGFGINQGSGNGGLVGAVDGLKIGYGGNSVTYNFEDSGCHFTTTDDTVSLDADCQTSSTIQIPNGKTLDGNNHTITAVDPAGGHFLGAIIMNGGATASVINLNLTASGLSNACDGGNDRLRGILFDGASGTISNNHVSGVRQGLSGCQEGNAIEARHTPFAGETGSVKVGPDVSVSITNNTVTDYQKNGITVNGAVVATVTGNIVTGDGPVSYIAQNGIQIGFGGSATVRSNTVSGNFYSPETTEACGILLYRADGVKASANNLFANQKDMCNYGKGGGNVNSTN